MAYVAGINDISLDDVLCHVLEKGIIKMLEPN